MSLFLYLENEVDIDIVEVLIIVSGFILFITFLFLTWGNPIVGAPLSILYIATIWYLYISWKNVKEKAKEKEEKLSSPNNSVN